MSVRLKIEKGGMKFKNKSSPLKLLGQSQPNFAEMIIGWSPSKIRGHAKTIPPKFGCNWSSGF
jgi:hypothetical protein